jgi:hypothetical protein
MSDLQSKLGGGLNKIQDSLQQGKQKLHTAQEVSQYKKVISENTEKRAEIILKLGEVVYKKIRSGEIQDSELRSISQDVISLDQLIYRTEVMLGKLNEKSLNNQSCPSCGNALTAGDKFCGSCGYKVEEIQAAETEETAACPTCEEQVSVNAAFCGCCGNRLAG